MNSQIAITLLKDLEQSLDDYCELNDEGKTAFSMAITALELFGISEQLPSAQPEQPPYVAEIEAEYQKAVNMPYIKKPLAKALYEVWKKHDREDAERRTDE